MTNEFLEQKFKELLYHFGEINWDILTTEAWDKYINNHESFNEKQFEDLRHFTYDIAEDFAIGFAEWKDEYICQHCNGDGYTVEVEAECCMQRNDYCCGIPIPIQIQRGCYCNNTTTKELLEIYKREKGL